MPLELLSDLRTDLGYWHVERVHLLDLGSLKTWMSCCSLNGMTVTYASEPFPVRLCDSAFRIVPIDRWAILAGSLPVDFLSCLHVRVRCAKYVGLMTILLANASGVLRVLI